MYLHQVMVEEEGEEELVASHDVDEGELILGLKANNLEYRFFYGKDKNALKPIGDVQEATVNASQRGVDFTGPMVGVYSSSNGKKSNNIASFDWFDYSPVKLK